MQITTSDISQRLALVTNNSPLVQCLTNAVVMNYTANVLLASGCAPAMVDIPKEADIFAGIASAVLINTGTPYPDQALAMQQAAQAAQQQNTPWVLDPVAVGALPVRSKIAQQSLAYKPSVIRGNPSEIIALSGMGQGGRGMESTDKPDSARTAARELANKVEGVVAVSGAIDLITDGQTDIRVHNGTQLLTQITGGGCALGALMAAYISVEQESVLTAVVAANVIYTIAAQCAEKISQGPGSFSMHMLDELARIDQRIIAKRLHLS